MQVRMPQAGFSPLALALCRAPAAVLVFLLHRPPHRLAAGARGPAALLPPAHRRLHVPAALRGDRRVLLRRHGEGPALPPRRRLPRAPGHIRSRVSQAATSAQAALDPADGLRSCCSRGALVLHVWPRLGGQPSWGARQYSHPLCLAADIFSAASAIALCPACPTHRA